MPKGAIFRWPHGGASARCRGFFASWRHPSRWHDLVLSISIGFDREIGRNNPMKKMRVLLSALAVAALTVAGTAFAEDLPEACNSTTAAVTGGPLPPPQSDMVVIRWLGNANFEFAYK